MIAGQSLFTADSPPAAVDASARRGDGTITSVELLADRKLLHILHRGELYQLRETRLGKLILTK